jgi:spermidine synthase
MRALHERIGLLPLLLQRAPQDALVIGLAGGATPGALSLDPTVRVRVVELAPAVARAAALFEHVNRGVLRRPNVALVVDDGRNYLLRTRNRYDIVTADLVQPFHAGAGFLYSLEYFRLCAAALRDEGVMVQWIGHPPEAQYTLILRTFLAAFPEVALFNEAFLVGSRSPIGVAPARLEAALRHPELGEALRAAGLATPAEVAALRTADTAALRAFAGPGPVLTDDHPRVEYFRSLRDGGRPVDLGPLRDAVRRPSP